MKKIFKSKKVIATLLILFAILLEFISAFIYYSVFNKTIPFPETVYYSSQIISSIFVISGVVIAVWQYYLSSKSIKTDLEIQQVQRAIDLSEYYKDNILNYFPVIKYIFENTGISEIINTIRIDQMHDFDTHELNTLFSPEQIKKLQAIQKSDLFAEKTMEASIIYGLDNDIKMIKPNNKQKDTPSNTVIVAYISNLADELLNNMEFFALHFSHKTADESVIYQSLHQTYLQIVHFMYYDIAVRNVDSTSKFYTNIIWLFDIWCNKKTEQNNERSKKSKSIQSLGTIVNKIRLM